MGASLADHKSEQPPVFYKTSIHFSDCDVWWKVDFTRQPVRGWRSSSKALPKAKLAPKRGRGHCLVVCCPSNPLELSESQRNHYSWEVCSASQWDVPKPATLAAGIGQQKNEPNSSPQQHLTTGHTTKASKSSINGPRNVASSAIFTWPLANWRPLPSGISTTFCWQNASTTSRRQKMLSKSSLNPKSTDFYATGINKLLSHWKTCIDCNGSCFKKDVVEPSYSDWKFSLKPQLLSYTPNIYTGISFTHEKNWSTDTWYSVNEALKYHVKHLKMPTIKATYYMIPFMQTVQTKQVHRNRMQKTGGCQKLGREKMGSDYLVARIFFKGMKVFWNLTEVVVAQHTEYTK